MPEQRNRTGLLVGALLLLLILAAVLWQAGLLGPSQSSYDATVTGTVSVDGVLADRGVVTFFPADNSLPFSGRISPDGSYTVLAGHRDDSEADGGTIASGEYTVTVSINADPSNDAAVGQGGPPRVGPSLIAVKYRSKATSGLRHVVKPGPNVIALNLEGAQQDAGEETGGAGGEEKTDEPAVDSAEDGTSADATTGQPAAEAGETDRENGASQDNANQEGAEEN